MRDGADPCDSRGWMLSGSLLCAVGDGCSAGRCSAQSGSLLSRSRGWMQLLVAQPQSSVAHPVVSRPPSRQSPAQSSVARPVVARRPVIERSLPSTTCLTLATPARLQPALSPAHTVAARPPCRPLILSPPARTVARSYCRRPPAHASHLPHPRPPSHLPHPRPPSHLPHPRPPTHLARPLPARPSFVPRSDRPLPRLVLNSPPGMPLDCCRLTLD